MLRVALAALVLTFGILGDAPVSAEAPQNVILITLDGVRWQDFFDRGADAPFAGFWSRLAPQGVVYGAPQTGDEVQTSNLTFVSLPAYQSILSGEVQPCRDNACGRIRQETVAERVVRDLGLPRSQVATIASWEKIAFAAEQNPGATFVNTGREPLLDGTRDPELERMNQLQLTDLPPWNETRWDKYTIAQAMRYLRVHHPRFLYISLDDSDDLAHRADRDGLLRALHSYDSWLLELTTLLDEGLGEYGRNTTILLTTDHGRGDGSNWPNHGSWLPESRRIWMYARGPKAGRLGSVLGSGTPRSHAAVRPTVEALLGLAPRSCDGCGTPLAEVVSGR